MEDFITTSINENTIKYTKFYNGMEVGNVNVSIYEDCYNINGLYIVEEFRNKGFAKELLECIISNHGHKVLELGVYRDNEIALHLYNKFNFKTVNDYYIEGEMYRQERKPNK